jgi:hypothetical protein
MLDMSNLTSLISPAEKMLKKALKKGEMAVVDCPTFNDVFDEIEEEMENYRIDQNYKAGISRIEIEKVWFYQNSN